MIRLNKLIKALNKTEKGYFRKFSGLYSNSHSQTYLRIFDEIDRSGRSEVRDAEIKSKFQAESFTRNYSVMKKYLFDQIVRSLYLYSSSKSAHKQIEWLITKAEILYTKGLLNESQSCLRKARKIAYEMEEFPLILQIIVFEKRIGGIHRYKGIYNRFKTLLDEERDILSKIRNYNEIQDIYYKVFESIKKERSLRSKNELRTLKRMVKGELFSDIDNALTFRAKITFCSTWTFYYDLLGDYEKAYEYAKLLILIWEEHPVKIKEAMDRYIAAYQNFLNRCYRLQRYDEFPQILEKLKSIKPSSLDMEVMLFEVLSHFEIIYLEGYALKDQQGVRRAIDLFDEISHGMNKYDGMIKSNYYNLFSYNICVLSITMDDYSKALDWSRRLINREQMDIQRDLLRFMRLLDLIIHFELGNKSILEHELRSISRIFEMEDKPYKFERFFLNVIRDAVKYMHLGSNRKLFMEYYPKAQEFRNDKYEKRVFEYFEFDLWLLSKIKGKSMRELKFG